MSKSFTMVVEMVEARLREAARTLKRLKVEKWDYPDQRTAWWPAVVREAADAYGYNRPPAAPAKPDPAAIDRMNETLGWLLWLENGDGRLVWGRAEGLGWARLEAKEGRPRDRLQRDHDAALAVIVERLAGRTRI